MFKTTLLALFVLLSPVASFGEVIEAPQVSSWMGPCLDSFTASELLGEPMGLNVGPLWGDSLANVVIRNGLLGRSLVSVQKDLSAKKCLYKFARFASSPKVTSSETGFNLEKEVRGIRSDLLAKKVNVMKWSEYFCVDQILPTHTVLSNILENNYRLVSVQPSSAAHMCLYLFVLKWSP